MTHTLDELLQPTTHAQVKGELAAVWKEMLKEHARNRIEHERQKLVLIEMVRLVAAKKERDSKYGGRFGTW